MTQSMTGFGSKEAKVSAFGKICVDIRSSNHKFLEISLHLPAGFLSLEDKIKKEIEAKIKRGRVTCAVNIVGGQAGRAFINKGLLRNYLAAIKTMQKEFAIPGEVGLDTLLHLPGVLSLEETGLVATAIWPRLKTLIDQAVNNLVKTRQKEGRALVAYLKARAKELGSSLAGIDARFEKAVRERLKQINTDEEKAAFLKDADISEETERLAFHIRNFVSRLSKSGPVGKELDFITQEMQREANTIGAKSCDTLISGSVVQAKSQIEKIREQLQNIE